MRVRPPPQFLAALAIVAGGCLPVHDEPASTLNHLRDKDLYFDVNDVGIVWPLLPARNRSSSPASMLNNSLFLFEHTHGTTAHRVIDMLALGNPLEEEMIHLTAQDHNELENPGWVDRSLISEEDFRQVLCGAFRTTVVETKPAGPDSIGHRFGDPNQPDLNIQPIRGRPQDDKIMEGLCGRYQVGTGRYPVAEFVDAEPSFALASKSSIWRAVAVRFKPCATPTKKLTDLLEGASKITAQGALPDDIAELCKPTLRVVAQPIDLPTPYPFGGNGGNAAFDFAMHLNYVLPTESIVPMLKALVAIKQYTTSEQHPTEGEPQYIHPGFAYPKTHLRPGMRDDLELDRVSLRDQRELSPEQLQNAMGFSRVVRRHLMPFLTRNYLQDIEFFGTYVDQPTHATGAAWVYSTFEAKAGGMTQRNIEFVDGHQAMMYLGQPRESSKTFQPNLSGQFSGKPSVQALADIVLSRDTAGYANLSAAMQQVARLEDPREYNIKGGDCVSCHLAQPLRTLAARRIEAKGLPSVLNDDYYPAGVNTLVLDGVTQTRLHHQFVDTYFAESFPPGGTNYDRRKLAGIVPGEPEELMKSDPLWRTDYVHRQFGYFATFPMISQRAINESAMDAKLLQQRVDLASFLGSECGSDGATAPGKHEDVSLPYFARYFFREQNNSRDDMNEFWNCLQAPLKYRYEQGLPLVPTTQFLEALRRGPVQPERYTGFSDLEECRRYRTEDDGDLGAERFKTVDFAFLFGGR